MNSVTQALHAQQSNKAEADKIQAKIRDLYSQLEALTERLAQLPKSVSASPIFTQMEKIQSLRGEEMEKLKELESTTIAHDVPATMDEYKAFLRELPKRFSGEARTKIIKALIQKIEISPEGFKAHYYIGQDHIDRELHVIKTEKGGTQDSGAAPLKNLRSMVRTQLQNGGPTWATF